MTARTTLSFNFDRCAVFLCLGGFWLWCLALTHKYFNFGFHDWDFAIYSQAMWNLVHGSAWTSLIGCSFLADHAHYVAFLICPMYWLLPDPTTLLYLKVAAFFLGAFALYKLAAKMLPGPSALLIALLYILHPANIGMLLYEFHFESLAPGLILWMFYCFYQGRLKAFLALAGVLMLVKENMPLITMMFGLYGLLIKTEKRLYWGWLPLIGGGIFFLVSLFVIIPWVRQDLASSQTVYWTLYRHLGDSPAAIAKNLVLHPEKLLALLINPPNVRFILDLLGGFFAAVLSPLVLLIGAPVLLQNLLSVNGGQRTLYYHYAASLVPFAAVAFTMAVSKVGRLPNRRRLLLLLAVVLTLLETGNYYRFYQFRIKNWEPQRAAISREMVSSIPPDAGVVASFIFLPQLSQRRHLYPFYHVWLNKNLYTGQ